MRGRLDALYARIAAAGRDVAGVRVVAVTKGFGASAARAALACGLTTLGENYVDELERTRAALGDASATWHYLGALQTNKIARAAAAADVLCALARPREVARVAAARPGMRVYVEVDYSRVAGRPGCAPAAAPALVGLARDAGLDVAGVMTVAPEDPAGARDAFAAAAALADALGLAERSMGMSDDLELALAAGSTEVRVGRALFGPRPARDGRLTWSGAPIEESG